jgi:hypothetical protein
MERSGPPVDEFDARPLNWRFVVPNEPGGCLLLRVGDEQLPGAVVPERTAPDLAAALGAQTYPAVVAADLGGWSRLDGAGGTAALLSRLASRVSPDGWLAIGLSNPWYPVHPFERGSLSARKAQQLLRAQGFAVIDPYVALPDQRCPAYLVSAHADAELDYVLGRLFLPFVGNTHGARAWVKRRVLSALRRVALWTPNAIRTSVAPAILIVARRAA